MPWMAVSRKLERLAAMISWLSRIAQESYLQRFGSISLNSRLDYLFITHPFLAPPHSITSSARASKEPDTGRPGILAVWALITNSNLLARTTGMFSGFAP